jgi:hypothetical protein
MAIALDEDMGTVQHKYTQSYRKGTRMEIREKGINIQTEAARLKSVVLGEEGINNENTR